MATKGATLSIEPTRLPRSTALVVLSIVSNILMLTGPLFMLQVYDRVLASRSLPTLSALVALVIGLYTFFALIEWLRARMTLRIALGFDALLSQRLFSATVGRDLSGREAAGPTATEDPVRDSDTVRNFLTGSAPLALLDLPWVPIYLGLLFAFHPLMGWLATAGGALLAGLMIVNEAVLRRPSDALTKALSRRQRLLQDTRLNAEAIVGMGMQADMAARWSDRNRAVLDHHRRGGDWTALFSAATKAIRFLLQSLVLALGALLVIQGEITGGLMIAASVVTSRAVAPVEQVVGHWRSIIAARAALKRIRQQEAHISIVRDTLLPAPKEKLQVQQLSWGPPGSGRVVLRNINFELAAGDAMGVLGPSGSGKTSLAKVLVGVWSPLRGEVRLDGALLAHYEPALLGQRIGYLPQRVELFEGTVAENISRFRPGVDHHQIFKAAQAAGVHDLINGLSNGYDTQIGPMGANLSAGQQQRIGLARAMFGDPFIVVLDEPNSNLDQEGEAALTAAVRSIRSRGGIVVIIAHRPSAMMAVNRLLVLRNGEQVAFGANTEVLPDRSSAGYPLRAEAS